MFLDVDGKRAHVLTGGPDFDSAKPAVVFVHGAGMDGSVWALQTRWFAHHGYSVLAPDLPGHGRTAGPGLTTIDAMADWLAGLLTAAGARPAALVGHSMGSLIALATAARHPAAVARLALIGTALEMKVGPDLLAAAAADSEDAFAMVNIWGHGPRAGMGGCEMPGYWMVGGGGRLLQRGQPGVLGSDLTACNGFNARDIAGAIAQPALVLQGARDMMTPLKSATALAAALQNGRLRTFEGAGHMLMVEEAGEVLSVLAGEFGGRWRRQLKQPASARP